MTNGNRNLTLFLPGLFGSEPGNRLLPSQAEVRAPSLELLLSRAAPVAGTVAGRIPLLLSLFRVQPEPQEDPPIAALTRLADSGETSDAFWLRADPVHLIADLDFLLLVHGAQLELPQQEARALAQEIGGAFAERGWRLEPLHPLRWYLRLPDEPRIRTRPVEDVAGKNVLPHLPVGPDAGEWRRWFNEVQMLLHASKVNRARERRGAPVINSLWFWGAGRLPDPPQVDWAHVYADDTLARGLARLAGVPCRPLPPTATDWLAQAPVSTHDLVAFPVREHPIHGEEPEQWAAHLQSLEQDWFAPLLDALRRQSVARLTLYALGGRAYRVDRRRLRQWWRRRRGLAAFTPSP